MAILPSLLSITKNTRTVGRGVQSTFVILFTLLMLSGIGALGLRVERVAGEDGRGHADVLPAEVGDGLLADIAHAHADEDRERQRRGHDVAHPLVGRGGQKSGGGHRCGRGRMIGQAAQLHIPPGGELQGAVPELRRSPGERVELPGGDHPAGQPDPGQWTVGGRMHLQRPGACVVPCPAHLPTVRPGVER